MELTRERSPSLHARRTRHGGHLLPVYILQLPSIAWQRAEFACASSRYCFLRALFIDIHPIPKLETQQDAIREHRRGLGNTAGGLRSSPRFGRAVSAIRAGSLPALSNAASAIREHRRGRAKNLRLSGRPSLFLFNFKFAICRSNRGTRN